MKISVEKIAFYLLGIGALMLINRTAAAKGFNMDWMETKSAKNLFRVDRALLADKNVQAILRVIRLGESHITNPRAYNMIVGGKYFTSFADHPRVFGTRVSTAAGAYQITKSTWDWIKGPMKLKDFSPSNQDFAAVGLIAYRGALGDVLRGDLNKAIAKLRNEWTSLPGAKENYGITLAQVKDVFKRYGGSLTA